MVSLHKPGWESIPGLLKRFTNSGSEIFEQSMGAGNRVVVSARQATKAGGINSLESIHGLLKGTQDWEFFWLRFWKLYFFVVSYVKILRFHKKFFLIGAILGEVRVFPVVLGLRGMKKNFELGQKFFFFSSILGPKYDLIIIFRKYKQFHASGTTLFGDFGSKCQFLFPLVWD